MLEMNPEKVCYIIFKARTFEEEDILDAEAEHEESTVNLDHEEAFDELEDHDEEDDPLRDSLVNFIQNLNEEEQVELVALTWMGRGDFDVEDWREALSAASDARNNRTADYLLGMPLLPDYLEEGLAAFDLSCGEFDESKL
jgi:hypothetical protein